LNGYTFCKDSAERYLERYRGNIRLVINRPSIIIGCCREPIIGWCDSVAAAGVVIFPSAMGISSNYHVKDVKTDLIPADIVTNSILVTTAYAA
jgi:fatty acyl-CoA reductase